jgi:hypothetical protein
MIPLDPRTKNDIVEYITAAAPLYVPEWRFDPDYPDAGAAVALIFASMFEETIERFNQAPQKNHIAFLNQLDISPLPPAAAEGYATLQTHADQEGVHIPAGFQLFADSADQGKRIVFETARDIFVTPARIQAVFAAHPQKGVSLLTVPAPLFHFDPTASIREDFLYIGDSRILNLGPEGVVRLALSNTRRPDLDRLLLQHFANALWFFHSGDRRVPFASAEISGSHLVLSLPKDQGIGKTFFNGAESCWIGCQTQPFPGNSDVGAIDRLSIAGENKNVTPRHILCQGAEFSGDSCLPFGEHFSVLDDFYLVDDETFSKRNATVQISFKLAFHAISTEPAAEASDPEWKPIIKKSSVKKPKKQKTWISRISWEYWNGQGWAALPVSRDAETVFGKTSDNGYRLISFKIPEDIQRTFVNAWFCHGIRLRILEIENPNIHSGYIMVPRMDHIRFYFLYSQPEMYPETVLVSHYQSVGDVSLNDGNSAPVQILDTFTGQKPALYFCLNRPPKGKPIRVLFDIQPGLPSEKPSEILWEYFSNQSGAPEFKPLALQDETDGLNARGLLTFFGGDDFAPGCFFGREGYWIRAVDVREGSVSVKNRGLLKGIYENTVQVVNRERLKDMFFRMDPENAARGFTLPNPPVMDERVWVDECQSFNPRQIPNWNPEDLRQVFDKEGNLTRLWVRWRPCPDRMSPGPEDRVYTLDSNSGVLRFGDGIHGKIPPFSKSDNIQVSYCTTAGREGNLSSGQINRLSDSKGFVHQVSNPLPIAGGSERESLDAAVNRGRARLSHRGRAVSAQDFEAIAAETSQGVLKVKCFSSMNAQGKKESGCVTLVILHRDYQADPGAFVRTRNRILESLQTKCDPLMLASGGLSIVEPHYTPVSVQLEASVPQSGENYRVQDELLRRIQDYLDPLTGNFDGRGWNIGEIPAKADLLHYLKSAPCTFQIKKLLAWSGQTDIDRLSGIPFAIPVNGSHQVVVTIGG